jgi:hypothetical protein
MKKIQNMLVWLNKMVLPPSFVHLMLRLAKGATKPITPTTLIGFFDVVFHMFHFLLCLALHVIVMIFSFPFSSFHLTLSSAVPHYLLGKQHGHFFLSLSLLLGKQQCTYVIYYIAHRTM